MLLAFERAFSTSALPMPVALLPASAAPATAPVAAPEAAPAKTALRAFFAFSNKPIDDRFRAVFFEDDFRPELFAEAADFLAPDFFAGPFFAAFLTFFFATTVAPQVLKVEAL
jgi:hypothetical protein